MEGPLGEVTCSGAPENDSKDVGRCRVLSGCGLSDQHPEYGEGQMRWLWPVFGPPRVWTLSVRQGSTQAGFLAANAQNTILRKFNLLVRFW